MSEKLLRKLIGLHQNTLEFFETHKMDPELGP